MPVPIYSPLMLGVLCLGLPLGEVSGQSGDEFAKRLAVARSRAEHDGKGLLLLFTGSREDPRSQRFFEQILSRPRFRRAVSERMILFEIELSAKQNAGPWREDSLAGLVRDLGINRVPSMHLTDAQLRPFGRIDYQGQTADKCMREIERKQRRLAKRDEHFAIAAQMSGVQKAHELDLALTFLGDDICVRRYHRVIDTLLDLDADGALGIKPRYAARLAWEDLSADVPRLLYDGKWQAVIRLVNRLMQRHSDTVRSPWKQRALYWKATAIMQAEGVMAASATLEQACVALPYSKLGKRIARMLRSMAVSADPSPAPSRGGADR